jgi:hypothetical protein
MPEQCVEQALRPGIGECETILDERLFGGRSLSRSFPKLLQDSIARVRGGFAFTVGAGSLEQRLDATQLFDQMQFVRAHALSFSRKARVSCRTPTAAMTRMCSNSRAGPCDKASA